MSLLEVENLDQFYGEFQALFGLSLHVDEGEVVAIIGANGAGKSTLLKTVVGLLRSPASAVRFKGQPVGDRPAHQRVAMGISLVPEGRRVFPSLSVEENLLVGGFGRRKGRWTVKRVYELFPLLARLSSRPAAVLSGGEQQALAVGRALMANPHVLLMDEISLGLAPIVVKSLYEAVPSIAADGTTMVLVEQDVSQALRIADRAYCFLEGRISLEGRPAELTRDGITAAYFGM
ncbi:MAG: ABC transporter ATP-binding protein [Actinomycetota bacterium]